FKLTVPLLDQAVVVPIEAIGKPQHDAVDHRTGWFWREVRERLRDIGRRLQRAPGRLALGAMPPDAFRHFGVSGIGAIGRDEHHVVAPALRDLDRAAAFSAAGRTGDEDQFRHGFSVPAMTSDKSAISFKMPAAARTNGTAMTAPVPSPSRKPRSRYGLAASFSSNRRCPRSAEPCENTQ